MSLGPNLIHFKVKSSGPSSAPTTWSTVQWSGPNHITTLDLKRHITAQLGLASSITPFEFIVTNATTGEEYREDNFVVHRNTSVWVRRVMGTPERAELLKQRPSTGVTVSQAAAGGTGVQDEEQQLLNFVQQSSRSRAPAPSTSSYAPQQYQRQSHGAGAPNQFSASAKPPPGYICHRCQQPGHYIRNCPTNGDPTYDGRRPKAAIAVQQYENNSQKFFLKDVEDPKAMARGREDRGGGRDERGETGYEGRDSFVPAARAYDGYEEPARGGQKTAPADLKCSICDLVYDDPTVTSCCYATFCRRCILDALRVSPAPTPHPPTARAAPVADCISADCVWKTSSKCPRCKQEVNPSELRPNVRLQKRIGEEMGVGGGRGRERDASPAARSRSPYARDRSPPRRRSRERERERDRDPYASDRPPTTPPAAYAPAYPLPPSAVPPPPPARSNDGSAYGIAGYGGGYAGSTGGGGVSRGGYQQYPTEARDYGDGRGGRYGTAGGGINDVPGRQSSGERRY